MLQKTSLKEQLEVATDDMLRVLIVGAGVAGVCISKLLHLQGLHPVLVERSAGGTDGGYMLGLMPLIDESLRRAGVWEEYLDRSVAMHHYQLRSRYGSVVRTYSFDSVLSQSGRYAGIERGELIKAIAGSGVPATFETAVSSLRQDPAGATAIIDPGGDSTEALFYLVIAADGLHSTTRDLVVDPADVESFDTGWGGWVVWADSDATTGDMYAETWGCDFFLGRYPVRDRVGVFVRVFVGGPRAATVAGPDEFGRHVRSRLSRVDKITADALSALEAAEAPYYWSLTDTRSSRWALGRVVLLGDAAAGFLPTAGIGAAMALESAAVLAEHLSGIRGEDVPPALKEFERRQRPRVLAAHDNSRQLAKLMFRNNQAFCAVRDFAMRFITLRMALGPIIKLLRTSPLSRDAPTNPTSRATT